jgi:hypothetical protein
MVKDRVKVKVMVDGSPRSTNRSRRTALLTTATLLVAIGLVVGGSWVAVRLIVNPGSVGWLSWLLPGWRHSALGEQPAQTLAEIEAEAVRAKLFVGKPIYLSTNPAFSRNSIGFHDFLLPLFSPQKHCGDQPTLSNDSNGCGQMVELRVYRIQSTQPSGATPTFELLDRLAVTGPEELAAIAPLTHSAVVSPGSSRSLPLTKVSFIEGKAPVAGVWCHLSGEWERGSSRVVYGQVVRYDPAEARLQLLLAWTSPTEQLPQWQQITGPAKTELVVNQTVGLEPQFQVYQVRVLNSPAKPLQLEAIALTQPALHNRMYENGLLLARNGLWASALQTLKTVKAQSQNGVGWSTAAQAQMDVIALHAKATQSQANQDWASPTQQIVALLMDDRWSKALALLRTARLDGYDISNLLAANSDRLWRRVETALRADPHQSDVQRWGALILAVQQNRVKAIAWIHRQQSATQAGATTRQLEQVLTLLDPLPLASSNGEALPSRSASPTAAASTVAATTPTSSRIVGFVTPVHRLNASDWLNPTPNAALALATNQSWYQVQVMGFQDGQQWRQSPFTEIASEAMPESQVAKTLLRRLGLAAGPQLQLISQTGVPFPLSVKAVRITDEGLQLLAAGASSGGAEVSPPPLAITPATVRWLEPVSRLTVAELVQQPGWSNTLVPALWQELQQVEYTLPVSTTKPTDPLRGFGQWSVELMDLTGDGQPEAVLTLSTDSLHQIEAVAATNLPGASPTGLHTLIFSSQGALIYSDLRSSDASLKAIADLEDGDRPILIVGEAHGYRIQRWSSQSQQFQ